MEGPKNSILNLAHTCKIVCPTESRTELIAVMPEEIFVMYLSPDHRDLSEMSTYPQTKGFAYRIQGMCQLPKHAWFRPLSWLWEKDNPQEDWFQNEINLCNWVSLAKPDEPEHPEHPIIMAQPQQFRHDMTTYESGWSGNKNFHYVQLLQAASVAWVPSSSVMDGLV